MASTKSEKTERPAKRIMFIPSGRLSVKNAILFILLFAIVGGIYIWRLSASTIVPRGADEIVLQYELPHQQVYSVDEGVAYHPPAALLYGNGALFCENDDIQTPFKLATTHLSHSTVDKIVNQILDAKFTSLNENYSQSGNLVAQLATTIDLNLSSGVKSVAHYDGNKPEAFQVAEEIITNLCQEAKTAYLPEQVDVVVSKAGDLAQSNNSKVWDKTEVPLPVSEEAEIPAVSDSTPQVNAKSPNMPIKPHTFGGKEKDIVIKQIGSKSHGQFTQDGTNYAVSVYPKLPSHKLPGQKDKLQPVGGKGKVEAATKQNVRYVWFYAADQSPSGFLWCDLACNARNVGAHANYWYLTQVKKAPTLQPAEVIRGSQTVAWYRTCHNPAGCGGSIDYAVWDNLYNGRDGSPKLYQAGKSNNVLVQFTGGYPSNACTGLGGGPSGTSGSYSAIAQNGGGFSVIMNANGYGCGGGLIYQVAAHEQGHTMGLGHTSSPDLMGHVYCASLTCSLNFYQFLQLYYWSPYFN